MQNWYATPRADEQRLAPEGWAQRYARFAVYGLYAVATLCGFAEGLRPTGAVRLLTALSMGWVVALYCALDARAHGKVFVQSFWLLTFLTWPISPLIHLARTRGWLGAVSYILNGLLIGVTFGVTKALASLVR